MSIVFYAPWACHRQSDGTSCESGHLVQGNDHRDVIGYDSHLGNVLLGVGQIARTLDRGSRFATYGSAHHTDN